MPYRAEEIVVIYIDASKDGLECILILYDKVIVFASRKLKSYERNYPTHDLDLAAAILALKKWRHYLFGGRYEAD